MGLCNFINREWKAAAEHLAESIGKAPPVAAEQPGAVGVKGSGDATSVPGAVAINDSDSGAPAPDSEHKEWEDNERANARRKRAHADVHAAPGDPQTYAEARYQAMLDSRCGIVDLVTANNLAIASFGGARVSDAKAVGLMQECIVAVTELAKPAAEVLEDEAKLSIVRHELQKFWDIQDDADVPKVMQDALQPVLKVGEVSLVDDLFHVVKAVAVDSKCHRRLQEELERTKLTWRKAVTARCNVLQFISGAVIPSTASDGDRFNPGLVLSMLEDLAVNGGSSTDVLHPLYTDIDAVWLFRRHNVLRILVAVASGIEVLLRHGLISASHRDEAEKLAVACLDTADKRINKLKDSGSTRVYLYTNSLCVRALLYRATSTFDTGVPSCGAAWCGEYEAKILACLAEAKNLQDGLQKADRRNTRQRLWRNLVSYHLIGEDMVEHAAQLPRLDERFQMAAGEPPDVRLRVFDQASTLDAAKVGTVLTALAALLQRLKKLQQQSEAGTTQ